MKTIFLLAGHHAGDPGACAAGLTERDIAIELRDLIAQSLVALPGAQRVRVLRDNDMAALPEVIGWVKSTCKPGDVLLDIHMNAASPAANGTEVLIRDAAGAQEHAMAYSLLEALRKTFRSRGIKKEADSPRKRLGILHAGPTSVLAEVCFITSAADMEKLQKNKAALCRDIAQVLLDEALAYPA